MQAKWYAIKSNCLHHCSRRDVNCYWHSLRKQQGIAPGAARRYAPRWWQLDPKIAADLHPSADGSAVRTPLVTGGGQAAGSCAMGQTDGRIALFQNPPPKNKNKRRRVVFIEPLLLYITRTLPVQTAIEMCGMLQAFYVTITTSRLTVQAEQVPECPHCRVTIYRELIVLYSGAETAGISGMDRSY